MWLRREVDNPLRDAGMFVTSIHYDQARSMRTTLDPGLLAQPGFRFLLQLSVPVIDRIWTTRRDGTPIVRIAATDHSWVELTPSMHTALQSGPTDLVIEIELAAELWRIHDHPVLSRLGITDSALSRTIWIDHRDQPLTHRSTPQEHPPSR